MVSYVEKAASTMEGICIGIGPAPVSKTYTERCSCSGMRAASTIINVRAPTDVRDLIDRAASAQG
jgi:hypothetical protein